MVFASSSSVYGDPQVRPTPESALLDPLSPYAIDKLSGEYYMRLFATAYGSRNMETVSLRYFNVYGPGASAEGSYPLVMAHFLAQRLAGRPMTITGDGTQTRDFVHVWDVAWANMCAAENPKVGKGEVINIGSGRSTSVNEIARMIGGPTKNIKKRHEPHDTLADISKARTLLGWEPTISIENGIADLKKLHGLS